LKNNGGGGQKAARKNHVQKKIKPTTKKHKRNGKGKELTGTQRCARNEGAVAHPKGNKSAKTLEKIHLRKKE